MGTCARNLVLLGDQMQLGQPIQGVHPGRSGESALEYLLDGTATIAAERGIFLDRTWRMHPDVCRFISDAVYDGRLQPEPRTRTSGSCWRRTRTRRCGRPASCSCRWSTTAARSAATRRPRVVAAHLRRARCGQRYVDRDGDEHAMTPQNILVVAPYNVQVNLLKQVLPADARVGTVDKFQGQEAEVGHRLDDHLERARTCRATSSSCSARTA